MKKSMFASLLVFLVLGNGVLFAQATKKLTKVMELAMPENAEGNNGASVVWHPDQKKYYAAYAGNEIFGLSVFSADGKLLSSEDLQTMVDLRGLWFHNGALEGNCYDEGGWIRYKLDANGIPENYDVIQPGSHQPTEHSPGSIDSKAGIVYFLGEYGVVVPYNYKEGVTNDNIVLNLGKVKESDEGSQIEEYNPSTVFYTGQKKAELAILNVDTRHLEFYDIKSGLLTRKHSFPEDAPLPSFLNIAYTNGIVFVFDKEAHVWIGYK